MLRITVFGKQRSFRSEHAGDTVELGREPAIGVERIVVEDPHVSRRHLQARLLENGLVEIVNCSRSSPVALCDFGQLAVGESGQYPLPLRLWIGMTQVEISTGEPSPPPFSESDMAESEPWQTIQQPVRPATLPRELSNENLNLAGMGDSLTPQTLAHWFETVIAVQRAAAGSAEFYQETAQALVDLVGLDRGMVLLRRTDDEANDQWEVAGSCSSDAGARAVYSRTILRRLVKERRTFFRPAEMVQSAGSLMGVESVVVSPIFDGDGEVVGAVYGLRTQGSVVARADISPLEAQVVQLLAAAVGGGLARLQREAAAARSRIQFEQFFSSALAHELERDPALLDGRDRDVTVMFSDIRNFSLLSQRLGPAETCRLVGDVMEQLTTAIAEYAGVVVDYVGDGLLAMWNAPAEQPEHARLACLAAQAMLRQLPELNRQWQSVLGMPLGIGVGLNTGLARVGNTGSRRRFKYGPLGHAVNLASRVEGATKHLGVPLLITGSTRARLGDEFATRRLCLARLQGIDTPVDLFELHATAADSDWNTRRDAYEESLRLYETGQWADACRAVYPLLGDTESNFDIPSLTLVSRAVECLRSPPATFNPVLEFQK